MSENNSNFESSWNTAGALIMEVSRLRTLANTAFTGNSKKKAMEYLIAIKMTICSILNDEEIRTLEDIENTFYKNDAIVLSYVDAGFKKRGDEWIKAVTEVSKAYSEYNTLLMRALQNHDLLLNQKVDTTVMKI